MKISVIDKRTRIPGYALLFLQTILLLVTLYFYMGEKYVDQWQDYLSDQTTYTVHLNNLSQLVLQVGFKPRDTLKETVWIHLLTKRIR